MKLNIKQIIAIFSVFCTLFYVLFCIAKYWLSDIKNGGDIHPSPYNLNVIRSKANLYYNNKEYDLAINSIRVGIAIAPNDPKLYYELAVFQLKNNDLEAGINSLKKAIELKPNYNNAIFLLNKLN